MTFLQFATLFTTGGATVMTGIYFIIKQYTENFFKKELEKHRIDLEHDAKIKEQEHQIKFSRFDQDQSLFLKQLYGLMTSIVSDIIAANSYPDQKGVSEKLVSIINTTNEFHKYFAANVILIDEDLIADIDNCKVKMAFLSDRVHRSREAEFSGKFGYELSKEKVDIQNDIIELKKNHLFPIKTKIRGLLG